MTATSPTGVSMHDLLASCAAADVVSRPPCPEGARGRAEHAATAADVPPAVTDPRPDGAPVVASPAQRKAA